MPFYEYECQNCKFYTEVLQKISDPPLAKCPSCGKKKMVKLVSAPSFRLKGGGWYETDFKSDNEKKRNLAVEKDSDSGPAASDSKSSDTKSTETKASDAKVDAKPAEAKASESKSAESKGGSKASSSSSRSGSRGASSKSRPAAKAKSKAAPARAKKRR